MASLPGVEQEEWRAETDRNPAPIAGKVVTDGVPVVLAGRLPSMLRELPAALGPERVAILANQARVRFHAAV